MPIYILPILLELENAAGANDKIKIMERERDKGNSLLPLVLDAALNKFRVYNIKIIPEYEKGMEFDGTNIAVALKQLQYFEDRTYTGADAKQRLSNILTGLSQEDAQVFERIFKKDIGCGIGASTVNKVWPNLIPVNQYMGAVPMSDEALERLDYVEGVFAQTKEDGLFNYALFDLKGNANHFGRSGIEYDFKGRFDYIGKVFKDCRVDGEMRVWNEDYTAYLPRKKSNGYVNKFQVGKAEPDVDVMRICFIVWDVIPLLGAMSGKSEMEYETRFHYLYQGVKKLRDNGDTLKLRDENCEVRLVQTQILHSIIDAKSMYKSVKALGEEGLIIKSRRGIWQNGKPWWQVKLKNETFQEMRIVGFQEHKKEKGRLGAFMLASECGIIITNCGSGLTKEQSVDFWNDRENLINGVVAIKFESIISKDGCETLSLNLPIFEEVRDKTEADDLASFIAAWEDGNGCKVESDISDKLV